MTARPTVRSLEARVAALEKTLDGDLRQIRAGIAQVEELVRELSRRANGEDPTRPTLTVLPGGKP
jgi:capsule polysaccharide export protein KpsE/RkpR